MKIWEILDYGNEGKLYSVGTEMGVVLDIEVQEGHPYAVIVGANDGEMVGYNLDDLFTLKAILDAEYIEITE